MKTNHRRNFKESRKSRANTLLHMMNGVGLVIAEVGNQKIIAAKHPGFDHANGHRGTAHAKRGAKKFINSRLRFNENQQTKKLAYKLCDEYKFNDEKEIVK